MTWHDIPGWSPDIVQFYEWCAKWLPQGSVFVEVGVFLGRSFAFMGERRPDLELWAVDQWQDGESRGYIGPGIFTDAVKRYPSLFDAFIGHMQKYSPAVLARAHVVRARSTDVILSRRADLVFIDGAHDYESVRDDIDHWRANLHVGGMMSGHDYVPDGFPGVVQAVDERFGKPRIFPSSDRNLPPSCWYIGPPFAD
jgi:hypothetical protein